MNETHTEPMGLAALRALGRYERRQRRRFWLAIIQLVVIVLLCIAACRVATAEPPTRAEVDAVIQQLTDIRDRLPADTPPLPPRTPGMPAIENGVLVQDTYAVPFFPHAPNHERGVRDGKFHNLEIEAGYRTAIMPFSKRYTGQYAPLDVRNCMFRPAQTGRWQWHIEGFDLRDPLIEDSEFYGAASGSGDGHAVYLMGGGDAVFRRDTFRDLPGQCIQLHWAHGDADPLGNSVLFEDLDISGSGYGGMGGSALTVRGNRQIGTEVTFRRIKWDGQIPAFGSTRRESKGAIMAWAWLTAADPWTSGQNLYGTVTIEDSQFRSVNPDRPVIKLEACDRVVLRNLRFTVEGDVGQGGIYLDARDGFPRTQSIVIADCTSNVPLPVYVRGERVGFIGELNGEIVR